MKKKIIILSCLLITAIAIAIVVKNKYDEAVIKHKEEQRIDYIEFDDVEYEDMDYEEPADNLIEENEELENAVIEKLEFDEVDDYEDNNENDNREEESGNSNNAKVVSSEDDQPGDGITISAITDNKSETLVILD